MRISGWLRYSASPLKEQRGTWVAGDGAGDSVVAVEELSPQELVPGHGQPLVAGEPSAQHRAVGQVQEDLQHQAVRESRACSHANILPAYRGGERERGADQRRGGESRACSHANILPAYRGGERERGADQRRGGESRACSHANILPAYRGGEREEQIREEEGRAGPVAMLTFCLRTGEERERGGADNYCSHCK